LRERCVNAVYVDRCGEEHLPPNPNRPDFSLQTLSRHYRRLTRIGATGAFVSLFLALYFLAGVAACISGKAARDHLPFFAAEFAGAVVAFPLSLGAYVKFASKSRYLSETVAEFQSKTSSADRNSSGH
jgi:hypothetical protein